MERMDLFKRTSFNHKEMAKMFNALVDAVEALEARIVALEPLNKDCKDIPEEFLLEEKEANESKKKPKKNREALPEIKIDEEG